MSFQFELKCLDINSKNVSHYNCLLKFCNFEKKYPTHRKDVVLQFEVQLKAIMKKNRLYKCTIVNF